MRVGAIIKSYHATQFLPIVLGQFRWVDKIVVMNYRFKTAPKAEDNTRKICEDFGHKRLICESGDCLEQWEIHNRGIDLVQDCDLTWVCDADEIILRKDQEIILDVMKDRVPSKNRPDYASCSFVDYKGDLYHASPDRKFMTVMMVDPHVIRFQVIRHIVGNQKVVNFPNIYVHHMMLVFPPDVLSWKAEWEHREEKIDKKKLLENWELTRDIEPPEELIELMKEASLV